MMDYQKFCGILNKHIFEGEKRELLKKVADWPERFVGRKVKRGSEYYLGGEKYVRKRNKDAN